MFKFHKKSFIFGVFFTFLCSGYSLKAQEVTNINDFGIEEYNSLSLPPLEVLFENAKSAPRYELTQVQEEIEKRLLKKEKRAFLSFFSVRGSWQYGNYANDGTFSDVSTPIFYSYTKNKQTSYSVGATVSIPLDALFDLGAKVKRQKLNVKAAQLQKEIEYEVIKREILGLYLGAINQLDIVKSNAETVMLTKTQYKIAERNFANGLVDTGVLTGEKERQSIALQRYESSKFELTRNIMTLEIITNTPIVKK